MIYTTYFAKLRCLPKEVVPVAICAKPVPGYQGASYRHLAPHYDFYNLYKQSGNVEHFCSCYVNRVLSSLNPIRVVAELYSAAGKAYCDGDIALVCYEKPTDFCHRQLVAEWLRESGFQCEEFNFNK
jgi:uncharacterized protein (DUF488 family)